MDSRPYKTPKMIFCELNVTHRTQSRTRDSDRTAGSRLGLGFTCIRRSDRNLPCHWLNFNHTIPILILFSQSKVSQILIYIIFITHREFRSFQPTWPPHWHPQRILLVVHPKSKWKRNRTILILKSSYRKTLVSYPFHDTYDTILPNRFTLDFC